MSAKQNAKIARHAETPTIGTRRQFIKQAVAAAAAAAAARLWPARAHAQQAAPSINVLGSNERIRLGFIGVGTQGYEAHLLNILKHAGTNNVAAVAVCDVSKHRRTEAQKAVEAAGGKAEAYEDYRKLLERKDIDAVFCATVDHWHARVTIDAVEAGKHVYLEKPMTRYLDEAFAVYDAVKRTGRVLQLGAQGCSDLKWHKAAEWIRAGRIGQLVMAQGSFMRNKPAGEWNYPIQAWCTPEDVNWNLWLGDQIKARRPFSPEDYFRWRKYYVYCAGLLGDLVPHKAHPYLLATGNPEFPVRVSAVGSKPVHSDKNTPGTPERDCPEIVQLIAEFPSGMVMHITTSSVSEQGTQEIIRGHKAYLLMGGNRVELKPERPFADEIDPETSEPFEPESFTAHQKNFFDAIRGVAKAHADIELAIRVQTLISLAEMSERLNILCVFDPKTRRITDGTGREIKPITYGTLEQS
ncbi:MAG: Gfo/Idh/MocA family oxidoreductase [Verrucomicrobiae bacterium]|nr:Gfo/Idh/MocA family oxidoreductase [Verrucomicrobiae bacterium]